MSGSAYLLSKQTNYLLKNKTMVVSLTFYLFPNENNDKSYLIGELKSMCVNVDSFIINEPSDKAGNV